MNEFKTYKRLPTIVNMRPYVEGEKLEPAGITVNRVIDVPQKGGWIAQKYDDPTDMWYINNEYVMQNFGENPTEATEKEINEWLERQ